MMKHDLHAHKPHASQAGFTIVELMIATVVFSLILLVIIYGVLNFSSAYFGGVYSSNTQDAARTITNDVAQGIEFSGNNIVASQQVPSPGDPNAAFFCVGGATYYYLPGTMYDGAPPTKGDPGLYVIPGSCLPNPASPTIPVAGGKELLSANMRVTYLSVAPAATAVPTANPRLYTVQVGLAYGESDLLCNVTKGGLVGGCNAGAQQNNQGVNIQGSGANGVTDVECRLVSGHQFCAHASLTTTVSLRVANSELSPN